MKLELLISTYGSEGIKRLGKPGVLPRIDGVGYLVSWQTGESDGAVPEGLIRDDVRVIKIEGRGLGANRDNALINAQGEWCMLSDDDLEYHSDGLRRLMDKLAEHSEIDYALARHRGGDKRYYPDREYQLDRMARGHFVIEVDLAFRLSAVKRVGARFNHQFGTGAAYPSGEGMLWLHQLRKAGLRGRYFPIVTATHPGLTTSERMATDPATLRAEGVWVAVQYPVSGVLRVPLVAWRRGRKQAVQSTIHLYRGYLEGLFSKKRLGLK